jgi:mannose-1-phosphate guanylyltransferase/mannose-6-phosphate isomerase
VTIQFLLSLVYLPDDTYMSPIIPVILCGGAGTRLWPVSRESMPKPFMQVRGNESLLQNTFKRAAQVPGVKEALIITNIQYSYKVAEEVSGLGLAVNFLLEPEGRNTAPAVALAALWAQQHYGAEAVLLVLPADHLIDNEPEFIRVSTLAIEQAQTGRLALFGITPSAAETGFGYIEMGAAQAESGARRVVRFIEKPPRAQAEDYLKSGRHVWNSGMFCFTAGTIVRAFEQYAPDTLQACRAVLAHNRAEIQPLMLDASLFAQVPANSIDYAIMEKADNISVIPCQMGWSDIGSWKALSEAVPTDADGNAVQGRGVLLDSTRTYVQSSGRLVAAIGVDNLVVIDTEDAVLVAHKDASQRVKDIVTLLKSSGDALVSEHVTTERPWGSYTILLEGEQFKIKRIVVKPGGKLSLQMHHHRSEHWVVVSGTARVTCGDKEFFVAPNESTYIPIGEKHRLENPGKLPLVMIEVQCGDYVGEDDIVRFSDQYGRVSSV